MHDPSLQRGTSVQGPHVTAWRSQEHHQSGASRDTEGRCLLPSLTGAGRCLGGRGRLCWDARGIGRVPLCLPGCGPRRGRLGATSHLWALGIQRGKAAAGGVCPGMGHHSTWVRATRFLAQASYSDSPQELPWVSPHAGTCDVPVQSPSPITTAAPSLLGRAAFPSEVSAPATQFTARSGLVKILHCLFSTCHPFVSPVLLKFCAEDRQVH